MYSNEEINNNTIAANEFYLRGVQYGVPVNNTNDFTRMDHYPPPQYDQPTNSDKTTIVRNPDGSYTINNTNVVSISQIPQEERDRRGMSWWKAMLVGLGSGTLVSAAGYLIYKMKTSEGNTDLVIDPNHTGSKNVFIGNTLVEASVTGTKMVVSINAFNAGMLPVDLTLSTKLTATSSEPILARGYNGNSLVLLIDATNWGQNSKITVTTTDPQVVIDGAAGSQTSVLKIPVKIYVDLPKTDSIFDKYAIVSKYRTPHLSSALITESNTIHGDLTVGGQIMKMVSNNGYDIYMAQFYPIQGQSTYEIDHAIGLHCYRFKYDYTENSVFSYFSNIIREPYEHTPYKIKCLPWEFFVEGKEAYVTSGEALIFYDSDFEIVPATTKKHGVLTVYTLTCPITDKIYAFGSSSRKAIDVTSSTIVPNFATGYVRNNFAPIFAHYNYSLTNVLYVYVDINNGEVLSDPSLNAYPTRKVFQSITPKFDAPIYNIETETCDQLTWDDTVPLWTNPNYATLDMPISTPGHARYISPNGTAVFDVPFEPLSMKTKFNRATVASFTIHESGFTRVTFKGCVAKNTWDVVTFYGADSKEWTNFVYVRDIPYGPNLTCTVRDYAVFLTTNEATKAPTGNEVSMDKNYYLLKKKHESVPNVAYESYQIFKAYPTLYLISAFFIKNPQDSSLTRIYGMTTRMGNLKKTYLVTSMYSDYGVCLDNISAASNYAIINKTEVAPQCKTRSALIYCPLFETSMEGPEMTLVLGNAASKNDPVLDEEGKFIDYRFKMPFHTFNHTEYFAKFPYICESEKIDNFFSIGQKQEGNLAYPRNTAFFMSPNKQSKIDLFFKSDINEFPSLAVPQRVFMYLKKNVSSLQDIVTKDPDEIVFIENYTGQSSMQEECYGFPIIGDIIHTNLMGHYNPDVLKFDTYDYEYQQSRFTTSKFYSQFSQVCLFPPVIGSNRKASMILNMRQYHNDMTTSAFQSDFSPIFLVVDGKTGKTLKIEDGDVRTGGSFVRLSFVLTDTFEGKFLKICIFLPELYVVDYPIDTSYAYSSGEGESLIYSRTFNTTKKDVSQTYIRVKYNNDLVLADYDMNVGYYGVPDSSFTVEGKPYNLFPEICGNGLTLNDSYIQVGPRGGAIFKLGFNPSSCVASDGSTVNYTYYAKYGVVCVLESDSCPTKLVFKSLVSSKSVYLHYRQTHRGTNELLTYSSHEDGVLLFAHPTGLTGNPGIYEVNTPEEEFDLVLTPNIYAYKSYTRNLAYYVSLNIPLIGLFSAWV